MSKESKEDAEYARPSQLKQFLTSTVPKCRVIIEQAAGEVRPALTKNQVELLKVSIECQFKLFDEEQNLVLAGNKSPAEITKQYDRRRMLMKTLVAKDPSLESLIKAMGEVVKCAKVAECFIAKAAVRGTVWGVVEQVLKIDYL